MPFPVSATWDLVDFSGTTVSSLLSHPDITFSPAATPPYFTYNSDSSVLQLSSSAGEVSAILDSGVPSNFTLEVTVRLPDLPANTGDLSRWQLGITVSDGAGRGFSLYFSANGIALGRVDDFGSVSALPETTDLSAEAVEEFRTIRIAVDSSLGRAYVYAGAAEVTPEVRYIIPVEVSPSGSSDVFRVRGIGTAAEPVSMEIAALRLSSALVIPNYPPIADAGPDTTGVVGHAVRLDGRRSSDIEGVALSYAWTVTDAPFGSTYAADISTVSTVDDGDADGFTTTVLFEPNALPDWVAAGDVLVVSGTRSVLSAVDNPSGIADVETDTVPDSLTSVPFRVIRQSLLTGADTETPYFVPDVAGLYRVTLVVSDGLSASESVEVLISVEAARAPTGVEPDVSPLWKALGDDWKQVEGRGVFESAWRGAAQVLSGKLLEVWQHHYNYSIRDAQRTFQRKWLAYRTLLNDTGDAEVSARHGAVLATHRFDVADPAVTGLVLTVNYSAGGVAGSTAVTFTGDDAATVLSDLNTALAGTNIEAYGYGVREPAATHIGSGTTVDDGDSNRRTATLSFTASSLPAWVAPGDFVVLGSARGSISTVNNAGGVMVLDAAVLPEPLTAVEFRVFRRCAIGLRGTRAFTVSSGGANALLGFPTTTNYLSGTGALVTDRTYFVDGHDLSQHGIVSGDLLVLNNGQSFSVSGLTTSALDPLPFQRLVTFETLPDDATAEWDIPDIMRGDQDYERDGVYPGDLVKAEIFNIESGVTTDASAIVVAQQTGAVAVRLDSFYDYLDSELYEVRVIGVKRRKAIPIHADTLSIPDLQDVIPVAQTPVHWRENVDYFLEPMYRDTNGAPLPALQFRDSVFVNTDTEPPDILWAELTVFSNDPNIESLFGRLTGFMRDDATAFSRDFNYASGVAGLMYAQRRGPTLGAVEIGAQILFGQSFAEVSGTIEEIRDDFSPRTGRILVRDTAAGDIPSEVVRSYYYKKDPLDLTATSGIADNPDTAVPWAVGDTIGQFASIGAGVEVVDIYSDPNWFIPHARALAITELEKFHSFGLRFNTDLVVLDNLALLFDFISAVRPKYTTPVLIGERNQDDSVDVTDDLNLLMIMRLYDSSCGDPQAFMYDDYRGDGTVWSEFDDGVTQFDAMADRPLDLIDFVATITWGGGNINEADDTETVFFLGTSPDPLDVRDITGNHVAAGTYFTATENLALPAGTYEVTVNVKSTGVLP